ncbi:MAG: dihydroorotate dehydrogenase electron transfer subunit [Desulfobulbaceae bacterium]|nr:dihydroorotate dehydrogenase electron transfer subunit [Desulfobulbaceae bacterium]
MSSYQIKAEVTRKELLTADIVRLTLHAPEVAAQASPGQFVMVKVSKGIIPLLRRPFSIHQSGGKDEWLQILFKVVGEGTGFLAEREPGDVVEIVGPLGHGFSLPEASCRNVCIVGGGMGIAPLFFLSKNILRVRPDIELQVYLGAAKGGELRTLPESFAELGAEVAIATDDGSLGFPGYVTELLRSTLDRSQKWQFYSCGPHPMMTKVVEFCESGKWPCQVSLETMMACGISACLGCTIRSSPTKILNSNMPFLHVCKEGPVFDSGDVAWTKG